MKNLTDFRKTRTVETGVDPRLQKVVKALLILLIRQKVSR